MHVRLRVNRAKTDCAHTTPTIKVFKYLGSVFAAGGSETHVNNRVKAAWARWRKVSGVICDKKMPIKISKIKSTKPW